MTNEPDMPEAVAIVGIACRFPGADTPERFFDNLVAGLESIMPETEWASLEPQAAPADARAGAKAVGMISAIDKLDAAYFGLTPREAEVMDPQQRLFLECAAEALQRAGHEGATDAAARIGVYAGVGINTYYLRHVLTNPQATQGALAFQAAASNEKDFVATQTSYRLDLRGPSVSIHTACSTSLVAVVSAFDALLAHQCDVALAGASSIKPDPSYGFFLEEGGIGSPDGVCRAFDAKANGTVGGSGVGVVALKRLSDALAAGDPIHAIIRGAAVNNDGAAKPGYTAPSVEGQAAVIAEALAVAGVEPDTIGYVEAHGTGTPVGDPIEVAALTRVFGTRREGESATCALGAVKTNIGHLDAAAGVAGLIKAALALERRVIPPTLHYTKPNPALRLDETPFYINTDARRFKSLRAAPRRASVSSFGIGGTNAHVVLEEAPPRRAAEPTTRPAVLTLSARSSAALDALAARLASALAAEDIDIGDAAWTFQTGRKRHAHKLAVIASDAKEAASILRGEGPPRRAFRQAADARERDVAFLFPGQGAQHVGMARTLYGAEATFRREFDRCADILERHIGTDIRTLVHAAPDDAARATELLNETRFTQPALFAIEYALARQWMDWGIRPAALLGHSLGEYVAATLAGVFRLEDALALVAARGRLMHETAPGTMLAVSAESDIVRNLLGDDEGREADIAAVNAPGSCVAAGTPEAMERLHARLTERGIDAKPLHVTRAFHSPLVEPATAEFGSILSKVELRAPRIPIVSNLTGDWLKPEEATSPAYWTRHIRAEVRFAAGLGRLLDRRDLALLDVGPGRTLTSLALARNSPGATRAPVLASLPHPKDADARDDITMREALARLWLSGATPDWARVHAPSHPRRERLPTYPWEKQSYWLPAKEWGAAPAPRVEVEPACTTGADPAATEPAGPAHARPDLPSAYTAAETPLEEALVGIWEDAFGFEGIGTQDDFFDLGGHSLLATRTIAGIRETFEVEIDLARLFEVRTIRELASVVEGLMIEKLESMSEEEAAKMLGK